MSANTRHDSTGRWLRGLGVLAITTALTLVATALGRALIGHPLDAPQSGGRPDLEVTLPMVAGVTVLAGVVGWALLIVLQRVSHGGTRWWTIVAVVVTVTSLVPLSMPGFEAGTRLVLGVLHVVVGAMVIAGFRWATRVPG